MEQIVKYQTAQSAIDKQSLMLIESLSSSLERGEMFQVVRFEREFSIARSVQSGVQLKKLAGYDWEFTMKTLIRLISNTCSFFNVQANMDDNQITMTASAIIEDYGTENLDDVVIALKMARGGAFGKLYGRIDGEVIMGWIALYLDRKYEEVERQHHNRKHEAVNMAEMHPKVLESVKLAVETKPMHTDATREPENGSENSKTTDTGMHGLHTGKPGSDNQGVIRVDHDTWKKFWAEFRETFTAKQLKTYKQQFQNNSMFGFYKSDIEWIDKRIEELETKKTVEQ